ncbi:hypothetical protein [Thiolapillus sp.]|uniref:hypothetical protein n=1 Tax=Thiolapillus sp. TaxID=2017437 RepID=UPI003AF4679D
MKIDLSTEQKMAIEHMKCLYGTDWKNELKKCWQTRIWGGNKNGRLYPLEIRALEELHNTIMNNELKYYD